MMDKAQLGVTHLSMNGSIEMIFGAIIAGAVGYMWHRVKKTGEKLDKTVSRKEVNDLIDLKVKYIRTEQEHLKKDIKELSKKLDKNQDRVEDKLDRLIGILII